MRKKLTDRHTSLVLETDRELREIDSVLRENDRLINDPLDRVFPFWSEEDAQFLEFFDQACAAPDKEPLLAEDPPGVVGTRREGSWAALGVRSARFRMGMASDVPVLHPKGHGCQVVNEGMPIVERLTYSDGESKWTESIYAPRLECGEIKIDLFKKASPPARSGWLSFDFQFSDL